MSSLSMLLLRIDVRAETSDDPCVPLKEEYSILVVNALASILILMANCQYVLSLPGDVLTNRYADLVHSNVYRTCRGERNSDKRPAKWQRPYIFSVLICNNLLPSIAAIRRRRASSPKWGMLSYNDRVYRPRRRALRFSINLI